MRRLLLSICCLLSAPAFGDDLARLKDQAARVTISRDDWGIAHIKGKTDADAVFGMAYAQAEDDFNRVETNYVTNLGLTALADGEKAVWADLRQKLFLDTPFLKAEYRRSPAWLKTIMTAWADGLNFYLATHPNVKPRVITHFEPWMALSFTEGSIGGDIESIAPKGLEAFYGKTRQAYAAPLDKTFREPAGSNGFAVGPNDSASGHALLMINPHTSFFFRSELQMTSDEGLNAYGAVTWGQPFIYQGFNEHLGFMHTTTSMDRVDEFVEDVVQRDGKWSYRFGNKWLPLTQKTITVPYKTDAGIKTRTVTAFFTRHGPIVREENGKWIAFAMMNKPVEALEQSFLRTRQNDFASYQKVAALAANSSNNTVYADDKGHIALLLPQFDPKRDDRFDYSKPVDGADPATAWQGETPIADIPRIVDPAGGWLFNVNDGPWWGAGPDSPRQKDYPRYDDTFGDAPRTWHATEVFNAKHGFTLETLVSDVGFDTHMPAFDRLIPGLVAAYDAHPDPALKEQVALLKGWDCRWSDHSLATSLAVFWGEALFDIVAKANKDAQGMAILRLMIDGATAQQRLEALRAASDRLQKDFGTWRVAWGEINRFQRNDGAIVQTFDDAKPSIPVPFPSAQWGTLASFGAKRYPGTRRYYGTSGNSFVAAVEFGPRVRAVAVTAGGESGDPKSPHFTDQAIRYAHGELRPIYFWPDELTGHVERRYHPGE